MKGLPLNAPIVQLVGLELLQLCFGLHQLQLAFDADAAISIEGPCVVTLEGNSMRVEDYAVSAEFLCRLLGRRVEAATRTSEGGLRLGFSHASALELLNDTVTMEAFQIRVGGVSYVA